jgi:hypothetical protein
MGLNEVSKEEVKRLPLQINSYNDIFSDFDPRRFDHRALSIDFLDEAKRATREIKENIELKFYIPRDRRNLNQEVMNKRRLCEHFKNHHEIISKEKKSIIKRGLSFVFGGIILMFLATYVLFEYRETAIGTFFVIFLEPASWFLFWEGLNMAIFEPRRLKDELDFYKKMSHCRIEFVNH